MAIVPQDNAHAVTALQNAAQQMRTHKNWVLNTYQSLNQNLSTTAQQTAAGFSVAGDQAAITALIGDLNRLKQVMTGTIPTSASDMEFNADAILGFL